MIKIQLSEWFSISSRYGSPYRKEDKKNLELIQQMGPTENCLNLPLSFYYISISCF